MSDLCKTYYIYFFKASFLKYLALLGWHKAPPNQYPELSLSIWNRLHKSHMYALYSWNPQDYESHVWLIYWVVKIYSWYFETNIQVSYLFGIARTRPIHPKIQINSLHFQSFKALNLIWSQKKKKKRVSKLLKKHFKSIKFLFFF